MRSLALCAISTGAFRYPIEKATHVALLTVTVLVFAEKLSAVITTHAVQVRQWLEEPRNRAQVDRIVLVVFRQCDYDVYDRLMREVYFRAPP